MAWSSQQRRRVVAGVAAALLVGVVALTVRRWRRTTSVGDRRALVCAEIAPARSVDEVKLANGKLLRRVGPAGELVGEGDAAAVAITSLDGSVGVARWTGAAIEPPPSLLVVAGLGARTRAQLDAAIAGIRAIAPAIVLVAGPEDDVDEVREAITDAGRGVVDGGLWRSLRVGAIELVFVPGSDDPSELPDHGRGCASKSDDGAALQAALGPGRGGHRIVVAHAAPHAATAPGLVDGLASVEAWIASGPIDADFPDPISIVAGSTEPALRLPAPRLDRARTTSTPGVVAAGFVLARVEGGALTLRHRTLEAPVAATSGQARSAHVPASTAASAASEPSSAGLDSP